MENVVAFHNCCHSRSSLPLSVWYHVAKMSKWMQYALVPLAVFTSPFRSMWEEWTGSHQVNMTNMPCGASNYTTEIVSLDPLAIYINGFMSNWEITHLRELADSQETFMYHEDKHPDQKDHKSRRIASSCRLPMNDPVVECIIQRSADFVGFVTHDGFEQLQVVKYRENERHDPHHDWFASPPKLASGLTCNRAASFFAYMGDDPQGGETCFHHLYPAPQDADPAKFSNINSDNGLGFATKPITGNAIFWMNLHSNNTGDPRVQHSALPIKSGTKYGMNILMKRCFD
ncbi:hypothetical protein N7527_007327 [Penicillium freii]|nr:hypothetical protein N7527_007327 [Penicillium freii]